MTIFIILLSLIVWGLIFWLAWWLLGTLGIPEPFNKAITVVLAIAAVIIIIGILTGTIDPFTFLTLR